MTLPRHGVSIVEDGAAEHLRSLSALEEAGAPVPWSWRPQPVAGTARERRYWCARHAGSPVGLMCTVARSRRRPWARLISTGPFGSAWHAERAGELVRLIIDVHDAFAPVHRMDVRIEHPDAAVRAAFESALRGAEFAERTTYRMYRRTIVLRTPLLPTKSNAATADAAEILNADSLADDEAYRALPTAARKGTREPLAKGLVVRHDATLQDLPRLLSLMAAAFERTDGALHREIAERDLREALRERRWLRLATLEHADRAGSDRIVGFALGVHQGDHVCYSHGATARDAGLGRLPLGYAPVWALVRWARSCGVAWVDLGGVAPTSDPAHPLFGISDFKRRFGGDEIEVAQEYERSAPSIGDRLRRLLRTNERSGPGID